MAVSLKILIFLQRKHTSIFISHSNKSSPMPFLRATPASKKGLVNYWGLKFCQRNSNWERAGLNKARVRHAILVKTASYGRIGQSPYPSGSTRILVLRRTWLGTLFAASKLFLHLKALLWWTKPFLGLTSWHYTRRMHSGMPAYCVTLAWVLPVPLLMPASSAELTKMQTVFCLFHTSTANNQ